LGSVAVVGHSVTGKIGLSEVTLLIRSGLTGIGISVVVGRAARLIELVRLVRQHQPNPLETSIKVHLSGHAIAAPPPPPRTRTEAPRATRDGPNSR